MNKSNIATEGTGITVIGAGLVGSLLSVLLARKGFAVDVFERRPDMRSHAISAGRSINLAISTRGIYALQKLGLDKTILQNAVPMKGRMIHSQSGQLAFQPYGTDDSQYINSLSRATLNKALMNFAEETGRVSIQFNKKITAMDFQAKAVSIVDEATKQSYLHQSNIVIGTDGSASAIRHDMLKLPRYECTESKLEYGYKELVIPPTENGSFQLERNALHIWPRGTYMLIALPNFEGSFTCTLFLPQEGPISFTELSTPKRVSAFFYEQFPDAVHLIESLEETFFANPTGHLITVKCNPWNVDGTALLMGDAAHGIVPFFGQGMNCGFEDCTEFGTLLDQSLPTTGSEWTTLFDTFQHSRRPHTDAIADMAVENFVEMRDKVADANFVLEKNVEKILEKTFPGRYRSRYSLVTFSCLPYKVAYDVGVIDNLILKELCRDLSSPDKVNLGKAEKLIEERLTPLLSPYVEKLALSGQADTLSLRPNKQASKP